MSGQGTQTTRPTAQPSERSDRRSRLLQASLSPAPNGPEATGHSRLGRETGCWRGAMDGKGESSIYCICGDGPACGSARCARRACIHSVRDRYGPPPSTRQHNARKWALRGRHRRSRSACRFVGARTHMRERIATVACVACFARVGGVGGRWRVAGAGATHDGLNVAPHHASLRRIRIC